MKDKTILIVFISSFGLISWQPADAWHSRGVTKDCFGKIDNFEIIFSFSFYIAWLKKQLVSSLSFDWRISVKLCVAHLAPKTWHRLFFFNHATLWKWKFWNIYAIHSTKLSNRNTLGLRWCVIRVLLFWWFAIEIDSYMSFFPSKVLLTISFAVMDIYQCAVRRLN